MRLAVAFKVCKAHIRIGNTVTGKIKDTKITTVTEGKLTVAISPDFAPMEFVDPTKTGQDMFVGFDPILAQYIADELGLELVIMDMEFDAVVEALVGRGFDLEEDFFEFEKPVDGDFGGVCVGDPYGESYWCEFDPSGLCIACYWEDAEA